MTARRTSSNTLYNVTALAAEVQVTRQTIYTWLDAGVISHSYFLGDSPVFTRSDLETAKRVADQRKQAFNTIRLSK